MPARQARCARAALLGPLLLAASGLAAQSTEPAASVPLGPEAPVSRALAGGERHAYTIALAAGQYLQVAVDQQGIDVVVVFFDPEGRQLLEIDSPTGPRGVERLFVAADRAGEHRLEIRSLERRVQPGRYELRIEALRAASDLDRRRIEADGATQAAHALRRTGTPEAARLSIPKYEDAVERWRALDDPQAEGDALNVLGAIYWALGEPEGALRSHRRALPLLRAAGDRRGEAVTLSNIGTAYAFLGEPSHALEYYEQSLPISRAIGERRSEAYTLNYIGAARTSLGEFAQALDAFAQALPILREIRDTRREGLALSNAGAAHFGRGDFAQALAAYQQSLPLSRAIADFRREGFTLSAIGACHAAMRHGELAKEAYAQALPLLRSRGDRRNEAAVLLGIARVERDLGRHAEALRLADEATRIVESLRTKVTSADLRASYGASISDYYDFQVELLMRMHGQDRAAGHDAAALLVSERSRARSLLDAIGDVRAEIRRGAEPALLERERRLRRALDDKEALRLGLLGGRPPEPASIARQVAGLLDEYTELEGRIRESSPRYAELVQPAPISVREIQALLDDDTVLLEYQLGPERSYLWRVDKRGLSSYALPPSSVVEPAARRASELLAQGARRDLTHDTLRALAELGRIVLGPLRGSLGGKRLLVAASGALHYVSFAALPDPDDSPSAATSLLLARHEIVMLPSAGALALLRRDSEGRPRGSKLVAVLADPVLERSDPRLRAPAQEPGAAHRELARDTLESAGFKRLPHTADEAAAILSLVPRDASLSALGFQATREAALSAELAQYRIVHFAAHSVLNDQHPQLSGIVLSLLEENGRAQDGVLHLHDIYNMSLGADLVVLSACRTAVGKPLRGEGLMSVTRGFMYAGVPQVVASLWDVRDRATEELMKRFYAGMLREKLRPAAALRIAQLSLARDPRWSAPFYWAGFVLNGDWQ